MKCVRALSRATVSNLEFKLEVKHNLFVIFDRVERYRWFLCVEVKHYTVYLHSIVESTLLFIAQNF